MTAAMMYYDAEAERASELRVLEALRAQPQFPIEIKSNGAQSVEEIKHAVERCEATGWLRTGPASHSDPRSHLTEAGRAELQRRRQVQEAPPSE